MKRLKISIILFLLFLTISNKLFSKELSIGISSGYYLFNDDRYFEVYKRNGEIIFGVNFSYNFFRKVDLLASLKYLSSEGQTTYTKEKTELKIIPLSFGVRYRFLRAGFEPYIAGGLNLYAYNEKTPIGNTSDSEIGIYAEGGGIISLYKNLKLLFNIKYSRVNVKILEGKVDIGGIDSGLSLAYFF